MAVIDRYQYPGVITTRGFCTVFTCGVCGASIVQVPGDAIDRRDQHADWHAAARANADDGARSA